MNIERNPFRTFRENSGKWGEMGIMGEAVHTRDLQEKSQKTLWGNIIPKEAPVLSLGKIPEESI